MAACSRSEAPTSAATPAPANLQAAEVVNLPELPTHWTNDKPIGSGAPGVTDAQLLAGTADPKQWLLYGGDYTNQRFSPLTRMVGFGNGFPQGDDDVWRVIAFLKSKREACPNS